MVDVRYYCPRCGTVAVLDRDAYLADKSVTPYPLEGWTYAAPDEEYEGDGVDGVRLVCGESDGCRWEHAETRATGSTERQADGCGEAFYLNFVRYEAGEERDARPESEYVELAEGRVPSGPRGPQGPGGPGGFSR
ncbi:hypothetical protein [Halocalculus aciditolerans]|uniref:DUF7969 domain-containing protein n=1 Tax=Halocalculus aciditolerans TaxID=1383812 RepID=A0A830FGN9_9EURY|nr:hypothetical protein [Halocalculus aciditolerans]GGL53522.1 hypothetical protein GCM10009039_09650 [Halocalculus aciditolerans]